MHLSRRMGKLMKLTTMSLTVTAVLLLSVWTLSACTIVAADGTTYEIFTPLLSSQPENGDGEPQPEPEPEPDEPLSAQILVQYDDHALNVRAIDFTTPISGLRALELAGLDITVADTGFGPAVCAIEGVGCPADDCFCNDDLFWGYNFWNGEAWEGYPVGASSSVISETGAIEGWRWGEFGAAAAPPSQADAVEAGFTWLRAQQVITDGSYSGSVGNSIDMLLALGANNQAGDAWRAGADTPSVLDFVLENGVTYAQADASQASKLAFGLAAAEGCLPVDAPLPSAEFDADAGTMAEEPGFLALAILGTLSLEADLVDNTALDASVAYLLDQAQPGGGWEWFPGWGTDTNTTALAIQTLVAAGVDADDPAIVAAIDALAAVQNDDGGFPYELDAEAAGVSDTNSTAYVVQGLIAAGEDPGAARWQPQGQSPRDFLRARQLEDGAFEWQASMGANLLATQQAIPALLGQPFPYNPGTLARCEAPAQ